MIDEKKLIEDLLHNDGIYFTINVDCESPETIAKAFQKFVDEMKQGFIKLINAQQKEGWIPVTDPPGKKGCYLVTVKHWCDGKPVTREAFYNCSGWISCERGVDITERVTHWMPLPKPMKDGGAK